MEKDIVIDLKNKEKNRAVGCNVIAEIVDSGDSSSRIMSAGDKPYIVARVFSIGENVGESIKKDDIIIVKRNDAVVLDETVVVIDSENILLVSKIDDTTESTTG